MVAVMMTRLEIGLLLATASVVWVGCSGEDGAPLEDAGPGLDAGPGADGGPAQDAGPGADGGPAVDAGGTSGGRLPIGQATLMSANDCPSSQLPTTECSRASIGGCSGVSDVGVRLKISTPPGELRGTVVLGTGGPGTAFYEQFAGRTNPLNRVLLPLYAMGYRVIQRAWDQPGWHAGPGGPMKAACRYPTLLAALREAYPSGPLCATGQSGGAGELSYALAHYGSESILDAAVITAGPPMGRLDHGCLGHDDPAWQAECARLAVCGAGARLCVFTGMPGAYFIDQMYADGTSSCVNRIESFRRSFLDDSVLNPLADLDYGGVDVRFVYGERDCSEAMPLGRVYAEAVTSPKQIVFVPGPHIILEDAAGADGILLQILESCVAR